MKQLKLVIAGTVILLSSLLVIAKADQVFAKQSVNNSPVLQQEAEELVKLKTGGLLVPFYNTGSQNY